VNALEHVNTGARAKLGNATVHHDAATIRTADALLTRWTLTDIALDLVASSNHQVDAAGLVIDRTAIHGSIMENRRDIVGDV
jgi:hypothetical protein